MGSFVRCMTSYGSSDMKELAVMAQSEVSYLRGTTSMK